MPKKIRALAYLGCKCAGPRHSPLLSLCAAESCTRLSDGVDFEADPLQPGMIEHVPSIEQKGRLQHPGVELVVWVLLELVPLCQDDDRMRPLCSRAGRGGENELLVLHLHAMVLELQQGV